MPIDVWEALENNGSGVVSDWDIPGHAAGKLDSKLDMLRNAEIDDAGRVLLPSELLAGPNVHDQPGIYKLIVNGKVALRPMLCRGRGGNDEGWTVLCRCIKKDNKTAVEVVAAKTATARRAEVIAGTRGRALLIEAVEP